ncbi:hypothetical protein J7337_009261 [Fusarium musae]|uniref:Uncharacterized protein n=1 Tax=Fusarium musae TaxID=1042133 RepID=A0A9P8IKT0_9HYPO|nr:hypothetical protein J7337_009261 [Fusarium musae]KAG9498456.1 hypothetical protein J7337_009261 [Fusarium musae]
MSDHVDPISDALADFFVNFDKRSNAERGQPTAQFGHLKIPPYRLETSIPELIRQMFSEEEPLLFVVPDMEHEVGLGLQFPDDASIKVTTYGNLLKDIHSNFDLGNNEHAPTNWRVGNKSVGWSSDRLPLKIVIIFQIDPNIPADCAISLAGIVQWSLAQSSLPRYVIRLVTLSAEEDCDLLERLLDESKLQCRFTDLDLAQYGEHEPTLNCTVINAKDVDTQVSDILTRVRAHPDKSRLVLCFDMAFYRALNAKQDPEDDHSRLDCGRYWAYDRWPGCPKTLVMLFSPDAAILPLPIRCFEEIHIIVGYSTTKHIWDHELCQMISCDYPLSLEERRRQLWWAWQGNEQSIFMHIDDGLTPSGFIEQSYDAVRFVEAHQLGGFIAAVANLPWFPRNRDGIIRIFATNPLVVRETKDRLITQRVIKSRGNGMPESQAEIFIEALPLLNYDYRLSLLVATEASPRVDRVKAQLAAMLTTKLEHIAMLDSIPRVPEHVLKECRGFGRSLAAQGSLWLFLGLFKNRKQHIQEHGEYMSRYDNLHGIISVNESVGKRMEEVFGELARLANRRGRDINPWLSLLAETEEMTPDEQRELHGHLFRAYMYQATVFHEKSTGDSSQSDTSMMCTLSGGHRCVLDPPDISPTNLVDMLSLLRSSGDKAIIGISH